MKNQLDDSWGITGLNVLVAVLMLIVGICLLPFSLGAHGLRGAIIAYKQWRATRQLTKEQRELLRRLWEEENNCRRYSEAYSRNYFELGQVANVAIYRTDDLIRECQQAGISDEHINAFRITSHDYWWWF